MKELVLSIPLPWFLHTMQYIIFTSSISLAFLPLVSGFSIFFYWHISSQLFFHLLYYHLLSLTFISMPITTYFCSLSFSQWFCINKSPHDWEWSIANKKRKHIHTSRHVCISAVTSRWWQWWVVVMFWIGRGSGSREAYGWRRRRYVTKIICPSS